MVLYENIFGTTLNRHIDYTDFVDLQDVTPEDHIVGTDEGGRACVQQIFRSRNLLSGA